MVAFRRRISLTQTFSVRETRVFGGFIVLLVTGVYDKIGNHVLALPVTLMTFDFFSVPTVNCEYWV